MLKDWTEGRAPLTKIISKTELSNSELQCSFSALTYSTALTGVIISLYLYKYQLIFLSGSSISVFFMRSVFVFIIYDFTGFKLGKI